MLGQIPRAVRTFFEWMVSVRERVVRERVSEGGGDPAAWQAA